MPRQKRGPRSQQHEWQPTEEDENKVACQKCGIIIHINNARRGIGPCSVKSSGTGGKEVQTEAVVDLPKMRMFQPSSKDHGKCNGCQEALQELPFNSKLAMVACNNSRCTLYRQRLRWIEW